MQNQPRSLYESVGYNQSNIVLGGSSSLKFLQENDSVGSPTLTTNSERSEITEASTDFCFSERQQGNLGLQQRDFLQHSPMQQSGYNELQLLQQQLMFKQLQDLQRQQQFQQPNHLNPYSGVHKQANNSQLSHLVDGMPPVDASQGYLSWTRRSSSPGQERTSNSVMFSKGFSPQQSDDSLYGTPVSNSRANMSQQSPIHGMYYDSVNLLPKTCDQTQNSVMQPSDFRNPFLKHQYTVAQDQISIPQESFMSNQGFQGKNMLGTGLVGLNGGLASGNIPMGNTEQINASPKIFNDRQGVSWSEVHPKATQLSKGLVPLDPLEEKILFDMEDNNFSDICSGGFGNTFDNMDFSNAAPSKQSGSWSALMQSAVAEASSSDTGIQEEWSGLSFQNTEPSADNNQASNLICSDKQHMGWPNNNLPSSISLSSNLLFTNNNSSLNSSFPNSQQPEKQLSDQQKERVYQDGSTSESVQLSPKVQGHWVDRSPQQKLFLEGNQQGSHGHSNAFAVGNNMGHLTGTVNNVQSYSNNVLSRRDDSHASNLAALSNQSMASSHDLSRKAYWNNTSGTLGNAGVSSQLNVQAGNATKFSGSSYQENIHHMQNMVNASLASQSAEAPEAVSRDTPLNLATSLLSSQDNCMVSAHSYNAWTDQQAQKHPSEHESVKGSLHSSFSANVLGKSVNLPKVQPPEFYNASPRIAIPQNHEDLTATNNHKTDQFKKDLKTEIVPLFQQAAAVMEHNSKFIVSDQKGINLVNSRLGSSAFDDANLQSLMLEAKKISSNYNEMTATGQCHSQSQFHNNNHSGLATIFGQRHSQSQFNSNNVVNNLNQPGQVNQHTTLTWHNQVEIVNESRSTAGGHLQSRESSHYADTRPKDVAILVESERFNSTYPAPSGVMNQNNLIMRPKKRKLVQMAWHKEINQGLDISQSISMEDQDWAQASNRLLEKMDDNCFQLVPGSKRRLIFTTKLIQQLFKPAPAFSLFADACAFYDTVSYFVARATLGDICSRIYCKRNAETPHLDEINAISKKLKASQSAGHQNLSVVVEGLIVKAENMENDLQRSEKAASFADVRLEIQDLERFAVINRFAKFHSRAQAETSGNSLSAAMLKPIPQRYVTAVPLPRNLPDGTPCLSL